MQVLVLRLMTDNSIEEHVLKAARAKQSLADQSITGKLFCHQSVRPFIHVPKGLSSC